MTAPSYTTDLTDIITDTTAVTAWTALGGGPATLAVENDYFIQGTACISKGAWGSGERGMIYNNGSGITVPSNGAVLFWLTHADPNSLNTIANGGVKVLIGSSSSAYKAWYMAGNDTVVYGGWITTAIDPSVTANTTTGSPSATLQYFGGLANLTSGPSKGNPWGIDAIRYGRATLTCTNGDGTNGYASFGGNGADAGAAAYDAGVSRRWGQLILRDGAYYMQGFLSLGSAGTAVDFRDSNRTIFIRDTFKVASGFNRIEISNASSNVDLTNISIAALGKTSPGTFVVTAGTFDAVSCTFTDMGTFTFTSNCTLTSTTFRRCGLITQASATMSSCIIEDSTSSASILSDNPTNISSCSIDSDSSNHAMELTTSTGVTYYSDVSDGGPTDQGGDPGAWTNDANAFDGSTATSAYTSSAGSTSTNYLMAEGTNAPSSGSSITNAYIRIYGYVASGDTLKATVYTDGLAQELGTCQLTVTSAGWGSYAALSTPSGGWTWVKAQALEVKIYKEGTAGTAYAYRVDIPVFTNSYTLTNNTYTGYAASDGSTGNEVVYNNSGGAILLNISGGSNPSVRNSASSQTVVLSSATVTIHVQNEAQSPIQNARVYVIRDADSSVIVNGLLTNASGDVTGSTVAGAGAITIRIRKSSTGTTRYLPAQVASSVVGDSLEQIVTLIQDNIATV